MSSRAGRSGRRRVSSSAEGDIEPRLNLRSLRVRDGTGAAASTSSAAAPTRRQLRGDKAPDVHVKVEEDAGGEGDPEMGSERVAELWAEFAADHYEVVEQLPLELHRNSRLLRELDAESLLQQEKLQARIRQYVAHRLALVRRPKGGAPPEVPNATVDGTRQERECNGAATDGGGAQRGSEDDAERLTSQDDPMTDGSEGGNKDTTGDTTVSALPASAPVDSVGPPPAGVSGSGTAQDSTPAALATADECVDAATAPAVVSSQQDRPGTPLPQAVTPGRPYSPLAVSEATTMPGPVAGGSSRPHRDRTGDDRRHNTEPSEHPPVKLEEQDSGAAMDEGGSKSVAETQGMVTEEVEKDEPRGDMEQDAQDPTSTTADRLSALDTQHASPREVPCSRASSVSEIGAVEDAVGLDLDDEDRGSPAATPSRPDGMFASPSVAPVFSASPLASKLASTPPALPTAPVLSSQIVAPPSPFVPALPPGAARVSAPAPAPALALAAPEAEPRPSSAPPASAPQPRAASASSSATAAAPLSSSLVLGDIARLMRELVRNREEKVAIAIGAYNSIDRHIRALDSALNMQDTNLLGPTPGPLVAVPAAPAPGARDRKRKKDSRPQPPLAAIPSDLDADPNEPRYCYCHNVSYGEMVGCDNEDCPHEWFHLACLGLAAAPQGNWLCDACLPARAAGEAGAGRARDAAPGPGSASRPKKKRRP